ncbi:MAG: tRNA lysidine(34) synthetase TilS [Clostridia bacterium]|nr:tRNA lysidine(34) synthetase TilS [Clostridia bacterium]
MSLNIIIDKIRNAINSFSMLNKDDTVLVGFSGGKDSVVLLHALNSLADEYKISVTALHVNHNIRGEEAKRDLLFCESFCKDNNIDFLSADVDAVGFSNKNGIGLEEGARILRYNAFKDACTDKNIKKIATAHTSSDNLETVLFNLARGCSLSGTKGIPPVRDNIIRPLIYCSTDEILEYAEYYNLKYVTDSTNSDTNYSRNRIRHNVVTELKKINPSLEEAVSNMCDSIRRDLDYIASCIDSNRNYTTEELASLHPSLLSRILIGMYENSTDNGSLGSVHLLNMSELVCSYVKNDCKEVKKLSLPNKIDFVITPEKVYFEKQTQEKSLNKRNLSFGLTEFEETGDALFISENKKDIEYVTSKNVYKISTHTIVKKSALDGTIIRGRIAGDVFVFSNMTKKVKKMLNEAKVPLSKRDILPLICDKDGIIWIPGFPVRDDARTNDTTSTAYIYYLTQETDL